MGIIALTPNAVAYLNASLASIVYLPPTGISNKSILPICKEFVEIAYYSLKTEGENEEQFLLPLMELLKKGKCPADI